MSDTFRFARAILADRDVAAISPSSRFLVRRVLSRLDLRPGCRILEFGPGPGVITLPLLRRLPSDARLTVVEKNTDFAGLLRSVADKRLQVLEADARDSWDAALASLGGHPDAILASIPFTYLTPDERRQFVSQAYAQLPVGGRLVVFHQYSPLMYSYLKRVFGAARLSFEPLNILPCFVMTAVKR